MTDLRLLLGVADGATCSVLANRLGISGTSIRKRLRRLTSAGGIAWVTPSAADCRLTERGRAALGAISQTLTAYEVLAERLGIESVSVRHVQVVNAVAATGSLSSAARLLQLPQPSVSAQVSRIERLWRTPLFVRTSTGTRPTELLDQMLPQLRLAEHAMTCLLASSADTRRRPAPYKTTVASEFGFTGLLTALRADCPADVELHIVDIPGSQWTSVMLDADVCIYADLPLAGMTVPAGRQTVVAFADPAYVLMPMGAAAERVVVSLRDLAGYDWLTGPPGSRNHQSIRALCRSAGFEPKIPVTAPNGPSGRRILESGDVVALTSATMVPEGTLRSVRLAEPIEVRMMVGWRPGSVATSTADWVVRWLRHHHIRQLAERRPDLLAELRSDPDHWPVRLSG